MNTYIKILLVASTLFFSCAVQSPPTGGTPDIRGPYIKKIIPVNGTFDLDKKQIIDKLSLLNKFDCIPFECIQYSKIVNPSVHNSNREHFSY